MYQATLTVGSVPKSEVVLALNLEIFDSLGERCGSYELEHRLSYELSWLGFGVLYLVMLADDGLFLFFLAFSFNWL